MFINAFQSNAFQNNAFQIVITPNKIGGGDDASWTKEERKRFKVLQKKLRLAEENRIAAQKADQENRKAIIRGQIDPAIIVKPKRRNKINVVVPVAPVVNHDALIANLQRQSEDLKTSILLRQAKQLLDEELQILETKRLAELDDEEAIIALLT